MKLAARTPLRGIMVLGARLRHAVGLPGVLGLSLLIVAGVALWIAWRQHQRLDLPASEPVAVSSTLPEPTRTKLARLPLPPASDIPLLLTRIQRAALDEGLGWPRADYRVNAASGDAPASVEVHCALKGPYPAVRRFVTALLQDAPTLTFREFSLSRASADAADIEAKLSIVVYLASGSSP